MKNLGAGGGGSCTTEDTKSGTSRKQFSTAKGSIKIGKKFKNSLQTLLLYFKLWGNLDVEKNSKTKQADHPLCRFSLSLSLSLSHPLSRAATVRFLPPADLPERDEGSTAFIQTTQFTVHPSIFHSGSTEFI